MLPLVVVDLDGTLIGKSGQVLPCVWQGVDRLLEAGVKLAVCTGRPAAGVALRTAERIGPRNPHIFNSGALVTYVDGDTEHAAALREADVRELIRHARQLGFVLELYTPGGLYIERNNDWSEKHAALLGVNFTVRDLQEVLEDEAVIRAQWMLPEERRSEVESLGSPDTQLSYATSPGMPGVGFVSVTRAGTDKGSALRHLAEAMRIPLEDIMAIGDSEGDIPMLDTVGHPVVMANASEALLERFDAIAGDVESCGVVAAFEEAMSIPAGGTEKG